MNGLNNGAAGADNLEGYEIVTDASGARWFGKPLPSLKDDEITLQPAWEMSPRQFMLIPGQQGPQMAAVQMPNVFPVLDRSASSPPVRLRWASRIAVKDFTEEDKKLFREIVKQSQLQTRLANTRLVV